MKIAYFSPLSPLKSGISDYSEYLVNYLSQYADIDLWIENFTPDNEELLSKFNVFNYVENPLLLDNLDDYDAILYNIGNNPYYHTHIYDVFLRYNGFVILHDFVLYYLITGYYLDHLSSTENYLREFSYNYGEQGIISAGNILKKSTHPLRYESPEDFALNKRLIDHAKGIIVHSNYTKQLVLNVNENSDCKVISQIGPNSVNQLDNITSSSLREKYGIRNEEIIFASFGFVSESKRIHQVIKALDKLDADNYKYLLVGEGEYINKYLDKYPKVRKRVIQTGYTTIEEFDNLIQLSDVIINLRYPYMGETSASLIRALIFGKLSIVTDIGWFSELPDQVVIKVKVDQNEVVNLSNILNKIIHDTSYRQNYSINAQKYSGENLNPSKIAKEVIEWIDLSVDKEKKNDYFNKICDRLSEKLNSFGINENDERILFNFANKLIKLSPEE